MPSVSTKPDERWSTDMARVWCGPQARWACLTLVMDCHTRELLGWRLSRQGNAKAAEATLEEALINRFVCLVLLKKPLKLRSNNGLVFSFRRYTQTVYRYGIKQEFIKPHTPQQNGMVERVKRTMHPPAQLYQYRTSQGDAG
jgi:putative transposase